MKKTEKISPIGKSIPDHNRIVPYWYRTDTCPPDKLPIPSLL